MAIAGILRSLRRRRLPIWAGIEVGIGLLLAQLPLFGVLGYELALVATLVASILSLHIGASIARGAARTPAPALVRARDPSPLVLAIWWRAAAVAAAVTAIPAVIAAIHGLWTPTCDWGFGVRAYLSMVTPSAILFSGAGVAIGLGTVARRAWVPAAIGVALVVAVALAALWRFYSEPPVYTYTALLGYFPGNLYDENIQLGAPLYWARLEQLAWVIAVLAVVAATLDAPTLRPRWRARRPATLRAGTLAVALAAAAAGTVLHVQSGALGYAVDAGDIQAELGGRFETEHFVIHYARTDDVLADIAMIADDHELRLAQVAAVLDIGPDELAALGKIHSNYFASREQKGRLMGARDVEMAKPWRREIYLDAQSFPHSALRHEIAHVVAGLFGDRWFGVSASRIAGLPLMVNPGMVEGLAVAVDWPGRYGASLTPHQQVRVLQRLGYEPAIGDVLSLGFLSLSSQRSYTTAGSFVRFLLDEYGPTALKLVYGNGGDFDAVYGKSLGALEGEWKEMLATVAISDDDVAVVQERFRHGGVFSRPCPHAVAARHAEAIDALRRDDRPRAVALLRKVCRDSRQDPRDRIDLAVALAVGDDDERAEATSILETIGADAEHVTSTLRASADASLADMAAARGDLDAALGFLARAEPLPLDDDQARSIAAKLIALRHAGPASAPLIEYFFGAPDRDTLDVATRITIVEPQLAFGWYLRGLQHATRGDHAAAVADLNVAIALGLPGRRFDRFAARVLAVEGWRVDDRAAVTRAIGLLDGPGHTEMDALLAADWRDRLARSQAFTFR
jgi:hypothetical protein